MNLSSWTVSALPIPAVPSASRPFIFDGDELKMDELLPLLDMALMFDYEVRVSTKREFGKWSTDEGESRFFFVFELSLNVEGLSFRVKISDFEKTT